MKEMSLQQAWMRLGVCAVIGLVMWFCPHPKTINVRAVDSSASNLLSFVPLIAPAAVVETDVDFQPAWQLASIFVAVIACFILRPFPMGVSVIIGFVVLVLTQTIGIKQALTGYGNKTVWLVVAAFFLAGGIVNTGLGRRVALMLVKLLGQSTIGLAYSICGAEFILGPLIPSNTVRGGGILAPIVRALAESLDSRPDHQPDAVGQYLVSVGAHANLITASMFLTGMAANSIVSDAAQNNLGVDFGWGRWALGAIVPGVLALLLLPWLIRLLVPPKLKSTSAAQQTARDELQKMGAWTKGEIVVAVTMGSLLILWMTKPFHGLDNTLVAWIGIVVMLVTRTQNWEEIISNRGAWDTFIWLGGLLTMANLLKEYHFVHWVANAASNVVLGKPAMVVALTLAVIYYYSMYSFSMLTAHISAMVAAFLIVATSAGAPPLVMVALLAYFSNLCASTTNYSTGPVVIYFGLGYVEAPQWFRTGFVVSLFHMAIWLTVGLAWWKLLGWW